jgi:zinc protease
VINLNCLSRDFDKVLPLLFDIFNKPGLDSARLELSKSSAIQNYQHRFDQPSHQLSSLSAKVAYKDNPKLWRADSAAFASVKRSDLIALKDEFFVPNKVIIAAAGDFIVDSLKTTLTKLFENWKKGKGRTINSPLEFNDSTGIFASEKEITQANIMMEMPFVKRPHPDYYPAAIASYILGGSTFSSRLTTKVRTERGLAYSIYSYAKSDYEDIGYTGVTLQTSVDSAKVAIELIKEECKKLGSLGPTDEELAFAKKSLIESIPAMFENAEATANTFAISEMSGRDLNHYKEYPNKLNAVTKEQVKEMAAKYFNPEKFRYSIVAPTQKLGLENVKIIPLDSLDF